jgi:hypothetical protein
MLSHFLRAVPKGVATVDYVTTTNNSTNNTTYTFTAVSLGATGGNRQIIVGISSSVGNSGRTVSSVTVAGVSATSLVSRTAGGINSRLSAIFIANVPTGATGNIVVTFSGSMGRCGITVYAGRNLTSNTPQATNNTSSSSPLTLSLTGTTAGFIVAQAMTQSPGETFTWTGLTRDNNVSIGAALTMSSASINKTSGGATTISAAFTGGGNDTSGVSVYLG